MLWLLIIAATCGTMQNADSATRDHATVPAIRVYVAAELNEAEGDSGSSECAAALRRALSPSFGTLLPVDTERSADVTVRVRRCEPDDTEGVYRIVWRVSTANNSDEGLVKTNLQRDKGVEWHMKETAKAAARFLRRRFEVH